MNALRNSLQEVTNYPPALNKKNSKQENAKEPSSKDINHEE